MLFLIAAVVILVDQLTKLWVEAHIPVNTSIAPFPDYADLFQFTHVHNTGAAFGMFAGGGYVFAIVAIIVAIVIIVYNFSLPAGNFALRLALGLQLGGALGNFIDRLRIGHVTDFFDVGPFFYIFNIADAAIIGGVIVLALLMWQEHREERKQAELDALDTSTSSSSESWNA
jgi:signal peptidase II